MNMQQLQDVKVLVVDDEEVLAWSIETELKQRGADVRKVHTFKDARKAFSDFDPDVAICDLKLPDGSGMDLLQEFKKKNPTLPVILITAHGAMDSAINAIRLSAFDYLQKPFNLKDLAAAVARASEVSLLRQKVSRMEGAIKGAPKVDIIGRTRAMRDLVRRLERVAASKTDTVLIYGETGSGKELAARAIHEWSERAKEAYIEINCASIPENLLESELFGYEKGAFTDARARKLGLFEMANRGTIFLDEIGEMPLKLQAKLLRALEYRRFKRLGGVKDIEFNARVVAATNRDLGEEIAKGAFRGDLYYRLNVIPIPIPPLRDRVEDIPALIDFFIEKISKELGVPTPKIDEAAKTMLKSHDWPGNVRELRNVLQRAIVLEGSDVLTPHHLVLDRVPVQVPRSVRSITVDGEGTHTASGERKTDASADDGYTLPETGVSLEELERDLLHQALQKSHYNQSRAAELLKISRHTLRYRLEKHGLLQKG